MKDQPNRTLQTDTFDDSIFDIEILCICLEKYSVVIQIHINNMEVKGKPIQT